MFSSSMCRRFLCTLYLQRDTREFILIKGPPLGSHNVAISRERYGHYGKCRRPSGDEFTARVARAGAPMSETRDVQSRWLGLARDPGPAPGVRQPDVHWCIEAVERQSLTCTIIRLSPRWNLRSDILFPQRIFINYYNKDDDVHINKRRWDVYFKNNFVYLNRTRHTPYLLLL